jgi:hypothetical protein
VKLYNDTDQWIILGPGESTVIGGSRITKDSGKVAELIIERTYDNDSE